VLNGVAKEPPFFFIQIGLMCRIGTMQAMRISNTAQEHLVTKPGSLEIPTEN
jgi:hypothetical protein